MYHVYRQWRRKKFENGEHRSGAKVGGPPLFGSKGTISRFGERFRDGQYSLVSFLFAVLLLTVPPCHAAICKSGGGHVPPCPMESAPLCIHPISRPNCKPITVSSCYTTSVTSPNFRSCRAICLHVSIFHEYSRAKTGSDCGLLTGLVGHGRLLIRLRD